MSEIKDRIIEIIESQNISKREFCRKIGVSHTYLNTDSEVGSSKLEIIISEYPNISAEWLLTGKGEMFKSEEKKEVSSNMEMSRLWNLIESQQRTIEELVKKGGSMQESRSVL